MLECECVCRRITLHRIKNNTLRIEHKLFELKYSSRLNKTDRWLMTY